MKRSEYFDVLKGIGILCVFYGHTAMWMSLQSRLMYNFHMPLFFLVSGIFFNPQKSPDFKSLMARIWRGLLLPYCFFVLVGYAVHFGTTYARWTSAPLAECIRVIHGEGADSIWFLVCLASVQVIVWAMCRFCKMRVSIFCRFAMLSSLGVGAHIVSNYLSRDVISALPFMLASVPAALLFFLVGFWGKDVFFGVENRKMKFPLLLSIFLSFAVLFVAVSVCVGNTLDIRTARFDLLLMPATFLGIAVSCVAAKFCGSLRMARIVLVRVGQRSLCLFAWELPIAHVLSRTTNGFIPYPTNGCEHSCFIGFLRVFVVLALAYAASYPTMWLLGKLRGRRA